MILDFQQGIITYPSSGSVQRFLLYGNNSVSLLANDGRTDVAFAHGDKNYLFTEASTVNSAWVGINPSVDAWLYWDIDTLTGNRTFGVTYVAPQFGTIQPTSPVSDQHWFDVTNKKMWRYHSNKWIGCIRVFACKINNGVISALGSNSSKPYAGTQVGLQFSNVPHGRIMVDDTGSPVRRADGCFITTEDEIFVNGSPVNTIRLEANVLNGTAVESIAKYQVVRFSAFGKVALASYEHIQTTAIAMAMEDMVQGQTGTLCMQGVITNPAWNWTTVGAQLWAHGSIPGLLVEYDPHVQEAGTYKTGRTPIARVLTPTSIFFDQGLGSKGDKGDAGEAEVPLATDTIFGISKLSVAAADVKNPVVVGDNDYRNFNDRYPLPHNQAASTITTLPVGILTGSNMQEDLQLINDGFVKKTGDTMTGHLVLSADPAIPLHAATKHYVDNMSLGGLSDVTLSSPEANQVLKFNGTEWVNGMAEGGSLWQYATKDTDVGADQYVLEPKLVDAKTSTDVDQVLLPIHTEVDSNPPSEVAEYWFNETAVAQDESIPLLPADDVSYSDYDELPARGLVFVAKQHNNGTTTEMLYTSSSRGELVVVETRIPRGDGASQLGGPQGWSRRTEFKPFAPFDDQPVRIVGTSISTLPGASVGVYVFASAYIGVDDLYSPVYHSLTALSPDLTTVLWTRIIEIPNTVHYDNIGAAPSTTGIATIPAFGVFNAARVAVAIPVYKDTVDYAAVTEYGTMVICFDVSSGNQLWHSSVFGIRVPVYADSQERPIFQPQLVSAYNSDGDRWSYYVSAAETIYMLSANTGLIDTGTTIDNCNALNGITITGLSYDDTVPCLYAALSGFDNGQNTAVCKVVSLRAVLNGVWWTKDIGCIKSNYDSVWSKNMPSPTRITSDATGVYVINSLERHGYGGYNTSESGDLTVMKLSTAGTILWATDINIMAARFADNSTYPRLDTSATINTSYTHVTVDGASLFFTAPLIY